MRRRLAPRGIADAVAGLVSEVRPATPLALVQASWPEVVGPVVAAHAAPVALRDGTLEVGCDSAVWAQEVELLQGELIAALAAAEGLPQVTSLRARTGRPPVRGERGSVNR